MLTSSAVVATDAPGRYAKQLLSHLGRKNTVEPLTDAPDGGRLVFAYGSAALRPQDGGCGWRRAHRTPRAWPTWRTCCSGTWSGSGPAPSSPWCGSAADRSPDVVVDELRLSGGGRLLVRPIRPADAGALVAMHARLSRDTIYRRYFGARPRLSPAEVDRFTRLPEPWRFALVAVREPDELVAVARYEGTERGRTAEIAIVVDDAVQRQGIGRALFTRLAEVARLNGLSGLVADVLDDNRSMLDLLRTAGLPTRTEREPGARTVFLDLTGLTLTEPALERAAAHVAAGCAGARARPADRLPWPSG